MFNKNKKNVITRNECMIRSVYSKIAAHKQTIIGLKKLLKEAKAEKVKTDIKVSILIVEGWMACHYSDLELFKTTKGE